MVDGPQVRFFWRVLYALDYWLGQARLGIVDTVCGFALSCSRQRAKTTLRGRPHQKHWFSGTKPAYAENSNFAGDNRFNLG